MWAWAIALILLLMTTVQAALSQLPMGDLNALLRHICQYMPMTANPGPMPTSQPLTAEGSSSDEV